MIVEASKKGCDIVVLPECMDFGWTNPDVKNIAEPLPGKLTDIFSSYAKENKIVVCVGLTEKYYDKFGDKIYNTAVLFSENGELLMKHRKISVLKIAQHIYSIGDRLMVAELEKNGKKYKVGVNICADNSYSSTILGNSLARMGAKVILSPSAWAVKADYNENEVHYGQMWRDTYMRLSQLYDISVIGVSNVGLIKNGPWKGMICIGCSLAVGPGGEILVEGSYGVDAQELLVVEVDIINHGIKGADLGEMAQIAGYKDP